MKSNRWLRNKGEIIHKVLGGESIENPVIRKSHCWKSGTNKGGEGL